MFLKLPILRPRSFSLPLGLPKLGNIRLDNGDTTLRGPCLIDDARSAVVQFANNRVLGIEMPIDSLANIRFLIIDTGVDCPRPHRFTDEILKPHPHMDEISRRRVQAEIGSVVDDKAVDRIVQSETLAQRSNRFPEPSIALRRFPERSAHADQQPGQDANISGPSKTPTR